jgi:hypothetical protein
MKRWAGYVVRMDGSRNPYGRLVDKHEGKRPLGRPRCRWEDNIKMNQTETGSRQVNTVLDRRIAQKVDNFLSS